MAVQAASLQAQPDELIDFSHLKSKRGMSQLELEDEVASDLKRATGLASVSTKGSHHLNRVLQLTGMHPWPLSRINLSSRQSIYPSRV